MDARIYDELINKGYTEDEIYNNLEYIQSTYLYKELESKYYMLDSVTNLKNVIEKDAPRKNDEQIEREILKLTAKCWNKFNKLEQTHPNDIDEFHRGIHQLQHIIAIRMCRRNFPEIFPIKK